MSDRPSRCPARSSRLLCLLGLLLTACTTEVKSLTHVEASLEEGPGLGPFQASHFARGGAPWPRNPGEADQLELQLDGQPVVSNGRPVTLSSSGAMISYHASEGTAEFGFARDGATLVTSDPIELSPSRFNYLILHGDPDAPDLLVVSGPREQRRVRLANVRPDGADLEFALIDADGMPLGDAMALEHGTWWSEVVAPEVDAVRVIGAGASLDVRVSCDPGLMMVAYDEPISDYDALGPTPFVGLLAPSAPGSAESAAAQCFEADCDCEAVN
jgi:hypothetical protein